MFEKKEAFFFTFCRWLGLWNLRFPAIFDELLNFFGGKEPVQKPSMLRQNQP